MNSLRDSQQLFCVFVAALFVKEERWTTGGLPLNIFLFPSVGQKLTLQNYGTVVQTPSNLLSHSK